MMLAMKPLASIWSNLQRHTAENIIYGRSQCCSKSVNEERFDLREDYGRNRVVVGLEYAFIYVSRIEGFYD
jgi:hypothetical protein